MLPEFIPFAYSLFSENYKCAALSLGAAYILVILTLSRMLGFFRLSFVAPLQMHVLALCSSSRLEPPLGLGVHLNVVCFLSLRIPSCFGEPKM